MKEENKKDTPLYGHNREYALKHNETMIYIKSHQENIKCKETIEKLIATNHNMTNFNLKAVLDGVLAKYDTRRITYVLANTIQLKSYDGRFHWENKEWAKKFTIIPDNDFTGYDVNHDFTVNSHPCLVDGFTSYYRGKLEKMTERNK